MGDGGRMVDCTVGIQQLRSFALEHFDELLLALACGLYVCDI